MKRIIHTFLILTVIALGAASCSKDPNDNPYGPNSFFPWIEGDDDGEGISQNHGDDKKVDIKGSLMNGDMKNPNIEAWFSGNTLYVQFNERVENCMILVSSYSNGRVVFSRQVEMQYPGTVRIYMGNRPSGTYQLYISNGRKSAEGRFDFEQQ
ncbi:MAG: DUF3244 domain-containing protein [Bacteroidales bacterium]|nr:DUF3244 domain-containing protein [Bacteroidales bacterium]